MRPVNLIPPEDRRGERAPMRAGPLAYILVAALLVAFIGSYLYVSAGNDVSEREAELASLEQQLASSQARADALQSFTDFASLEQARTATVTGLARSRFDWERVLRELALVIPGDVSLTSLTGSAGGEQAAAAGGSADGAASAESLQVPNLTMVGCATSHQSVARMVAALKDIDGVTRVGLGSSTAGVTDGSAPGAAATQEGGAGPTCPDPDAASFDVTVAFDEVQIEAAALGAAAAAPAPVADDGSGVAEAEAEREQAQESVESATGKGREAVDRYVPGT